MINRIAARVSAPAALSVGFALALAGPAAGARFPQALAAAPPAPGSTAPAPALSVSGAALYAPATGQLLFGDNVHRHLSIASTTKLMTALVTLQHVRHLSAVYAQNDWYPAPDDSQLGLVPGDRMSVHDLLIAMMLPSADDAAEDLAFHVGHGSVPSFISMMNAEARALQLRDTHYATPIGFDVPGNYSSAYDLVRLAGYDMSRSPYFARVVALAGAVVRVNGVPRWVPNLNDLVGRYWWIDGVKTGHTAAAGYVLVASGRRDGLQLIAAALGNSSRQSADGNGLALLNWGYSQFRTWTPVKRGQVLARRGAAGVPRLRVPLVAKSAFVRVLPRSSRVHVVVRAPRQLDGPMRAGQVVGTAVIFDGRRALARIRLLVKHKVPAPSAGSGEGQPNPGQQTTTTAGPTTGAQPTIATTTGQPLNGRPAADGVPGGSTGRSRTMPARLQSGLSTLAASIVLLALGGWARRVRRTGWRIRRGYAIRQRGESKGE